MRNRVLETFLEEDDSLELEDISSDFVESEVGMYDFLKNWELYKSKPGLEGRIKAWLSETEQPSVNWENLRDAVDSLASRGGWVASFLT